MLWTEPDYLLLQELVDMPNRLLAKKIELVSFPYMPSGKHWSKFVEALMASDGPDEFVKAAEAIIQKLGAKFDYGESAIQEGFEITKQKILAAGGMPPSIDTSDMPGPQVVLLNGVELEALP